MGLAFLSRESKVKHTIQPSVPIRCPHCGEALQAVLYHRIQVHGCPGCGGIWLEKGEVERLAGPQEGHWLQQLFEAFLLAEA